MGNSRRKRILLVDDEPDVRAFVGHVLADAGYEVETAEDGEQALRRLEARRPDLIVLDLQMPRIDGWGVLERLAERETPPPVIMLTALDDAASFARALQLGAAAFVNKPFRFGRFLETCARVLAASSETVEHERRSEPRRPVSAAVRVLSEDHVLLAPGELVDLSRHGARVRLGAACPVGSQVWLAIYQSSGQVGPKLAGTVRWCAAAEGAHTMGLSLSAMFGAAA